jgi:hypothetical protein
VTAPCWQNFFQNQLSTVCNIRKNSTLPLWKRTFVLLLMEEHYTDSNCWIFHTRVYTAHGDALFLILVMYTFTCSDSLRNKPLYDEYVLIIYSVQREVPTYKNVLVTFNSNKLDWFDVIPLLTSSPHNWIPKQSPATTGHSNGYESKNSTVL